MTTPYVPDWMTGAVNSRLPNADKDRVSGTAHRCFFGSFADIKQVTLVENVTTKSITFTPKDPIQVTSTQFKKSGRGVKEETTGVRIVGFYGVTVRVLDGNTKILSQWKDYPHKKGSYGHMALCAGGRVLQSQALSYAEETICCKGILGLLEQFSFDLKLAGRESLQLKDYCLDMVSISVPPSAKVQIGFLPVYEQFRAEIEHDNEEDWAAIGTVVAIGAVAVGAAIVSCGLADGLILGALAATEVGTEGGIVAGAIASEGMTGGIDVAYTVLEIDGVAVAEEAGVWVPKATPTVPSPPPQPSSQVLLELRPIVGDLKALKATELEPLYIDWLK